MGSREPGFDIRGGRLGIVVLVVLLLGGAFSSVGMGAKNKAKPPATSSGTTITGSVFVAREPYSVNVGGTPQTVDLYGYPRTFDFGGQIPNFLNATNPESGQFDFATINVWDAVNGKEMVVTNHNGKMGPTGVPGRVFKIDGYTAVGYKAGDGVVQGTLRTQVNTFAVPSRRRLVWDFVVRFGGADLSKPWTFSPRDHHPATIWQLKSDSVSYPALLIVLDTDPNNSQKLAFDFSERTDPNGRGSLLGRATGLAPQQDIAIVIDAFLDERSNSSGGQGYVKVWVNNLKVVDVARPTLTAQATTPHHWKFGMYLYNDTSPLSFDRFGFWKKVRMIVPS